MPHSKAVFAPGVSKKAMLDNALDEYVTKRFRKKGISTTNEQDLIRTVEDTSNLEDVYWATILLRQCGTLRAVPALKKAMYYPKQDVKITSLYTLAEIAKDTEADFYVAALSDRQYREKWAAMYAICAYGNPSAVVPVIQRLEAILSKPRGREWGNNTEVVYAVKFLARQATSDSRAAEAMVFVEGRWSRLLPPERAELAASLPYFHTHQAEQVTA